MVIKCTHLIQIFMCIILVKYNMSQVNLHLQLLTAVVVLQKEVTK